MHRLQLLIAASALATVALLYPLKIPDAAYAPLYRWFEARGMLGLFQGQVEPALFFGASPLVIKEAAANTALLLLVVLFVFWKALFPADPLRPTGNSGRPAGQWWLWAFVAWAGASLLWTPTPAFSLRTFYTLALFAFGFVCVSELIVRRADWMRFYGLIIVISAVLAAISFLQHLDLTRGFMLDWEQVRVRNRIGSFIGHNTGLSAFIMPSLFLTLGVLEAGRPARRALRWALWGYLVLFAFVIVAAQSRGVWLTLAVFVPVYYVVLKRRLGLPLPWRRAAAGAVLIAAVTALQVLPLSFNPFFNRAAPIKQRLDYLFPDTLRTETRLRILVCSIPLIAQKPLWGHGLGTFRYVYPKAQGDYLSAHPDTRIVPTNLRTIRAHNDWLQIAIELGLAGLGLAVGGIVYYARWGWRRLRGADARWTHLMIAVFVSLMAQLFHALMDFPFHIPPTALLAVVMGALWLAGARLAAADRAEGADRTAKSDQSEARPNAGGGNAGSDSRISNVANDRVQSSHPVVRPRRVVLLILILALVVPVPVRLPSAQGSRWNVKFVALELARAAVLPVVVDYHQSRAQRFLNTAEQPQLSAQQRWEKLQEGFQHILKAQRLDFLNAEVRQDLATFRYKRGQMLFEEARRLARAGHSELAQARFAQARQLFLNSIQDVDEAIAMGFRFHTCYHLRALNASSLEEIEPGRGWREKAKSDLYEAIHYTPAFGAALQDLSELLVQEKPVNAAEVYRLRGLIARYDPQWFRANYIMKAYVALYEKNYDQALFMLRDLLKAAPDFEELYHALANTLLRLGRAAEGRAVLETARERGIHSVELDKAWALYTILTGRNEEGLRRIRALMAPLKKPEPGLVVLEWVALRRLGRMEELKTSKQRFRATAHDYDAYLLLEGTIWYETFKDKALGVQLWQEALRAVPRPQPHVFVHLVQHYEREGDLDEARRLLRAGLNLHPDDPILGRLRARLLSGDEEASGGATAPGGAPAPGGASLESASGGTANDR
ncbi:MAG: hypothetical protein Kow0059_04860 [Candidatus Sumerlaeia bacterium]